VELEFDGAALMRLLVVSLVVEVVAVVDLTVGRRGGLIGIEAVVAVDEATDVHGANAPGGRGGSGRWGVGWGCGRRGSRCGWSRCLSAGYQSHGYCGTGKGLQHTGSGEDFGHYSSKKRLVV